jgi:raffinose/stachyose/melibiose transport system substrate-binding protein
VFYNTKVYAKLGLKIPATWDQFMANKAKYATTPAALAGFQHLEDVHEAGYLNKDFASAKYEEGLSAVATGKAAHYPMLTVAIPPMFGVAPEHVNDVGFFAMPGTDAAKAGATIWEPNGIFIPKTTEDANLDTAKKVPGVHDIAEGAARRRLRSRPSAGRSSSRDASCRPPWRQR